MEEQIQNESKSTKTVIIVIIAVLITALLVGVGVFAYQQDVIKKNMIEADEQIKKLQEQINCKGTWDDNECNTAPKITLLFPKGGETICDNNPLTIKWDATYYDGLVTMRLLNGGSTGIGPGQRAEKGEYLWENVREIADNLSGGGAEDTYRVRINLQELNFNDDDAGSFDISKFLTIKNCINEDIDKPIDTSDWTTYQNEDLGVEFNHPPELGNFVDEGRNAYLTHNIRPEEITTISYIYLNAFSDTSVNNWMEEIKKAFENNEGVGDPATLRFSTSVGDLLTEKNVGNNCIQDFDFIRNVTEASCEIISINDNYAFKISGPGPRGSEVNEFKYLFFENNTWYDFTQRHQKVLDSEFEVFSKIISTFNFTK